MIKNLLRGEWNKIKIQAQENWDWMTDNDLEEIGGEWDSFIVKLQEHYGYTPQEAEDAVYLFMQELEDYGQFPQ